MSTLTERLSALQEQSQHVDRCPVGRALDAMEEEDREMMERILASKVANQTISDNLRPDLIIDRGTIGKHRKGTCRCPK